MKKNYTIKQVREIIFKSSNFYWYYNNEIDNIDSLDILNDFNNYIDLAIIKIVKNKDLKKYKELEKNKYDLYITINNRLFGIYPLNSKDKEFEFEIEKINL